MQPPPHALGTPPPPARHPPPRSRSSPPSWPTSRATTGTGGPYPSTPAWGRAPCSSASTGWRTGAGWSRAGRIARWPRATAVAAAVLHPDRRRAAGGAGAARGAVQGSAAVRAWWRGGLSIADAGRGVEELSDQINRLVEQLRACDRRIHDHARADRYCERDQAAARSIAEQTEVVLSMLAEVGIGFDVNLNLGLSRISREARACARGQVLGLD